MNTGFQKRVRESKTAKRESNLITAHGLILLKVLKISDFLDGKKKDFDSRSNVVTVGVQRTGIKMKNRNKIFDYRSLLDRVGVQRIGIKKSTFFANLYRGVFFF